VGSGKGKEKALDEIAADEGKKEGSNEAEACYVVSASCSIMPTQIRRVRIPVV
jgi:hypothetical protein